MDRRRFIILGSAGSVAVLTGCGGGGGAETMMPPTGTTPPPVNPPAPNPPPAAPVSPLKAGQPLTDLVPLPNASATPGVFAATLLAQRASKVMLPGTSTEFWTYNSSVPGPLIDVYEGDTVRVRLENRLSQETTVHWHGLPVPPDQDGNPMDPVASGATRLYEFTLPVGSAGTYWYHPHPHELTAEQVFRGMAGLFIVRSRTDPVPSTIEEKLLVVSDLRLAEDGTIPPNSPMDWQNGREGNYLLVNGQYQPVLSIDPGGSQRWRILNATNARYLRLALTGHTMTLIGTDGGLLGAPIPGLDEILLAPAERVEVIVTAGISSPASAVLQSLPYDRGGMMSFLIDGKSFDPARVDLTSRLNEVEQWTIENRSSMDHPFHLHGTQFQVVNRTRNGVTIAEPFVAHAAESQFSQMSPQAARATSAWQSLNVSATKRRT